MSLTLSPMTELEAVNEILRASGDSPVLSLTEPLRMEVSAAKDILKSTNRMFQSKGWHFNHEEAYPLQPDVDGFVNVTDNMLSVRLNAAYRTFDMAVRGAKLYNKTDHTFTFTETLKYDVTWYLPFEEMPQAARDYVTLLAARRFQAGYVGSDALYKFTAEDEAEALAAFLQADQMAGDYNMLTGSSHVYNIIKRDPSDALIQ